jgi:acetyl-CoA synthetase
MLNALHSIFSTGEPLDPAITEWTQQHLGLPTRDAWWQSETGSIMIAQYPHRSLGSYSNKRTTSASYKASSNLAQKLPDNELTPGRMGRAVPGIEMVIATVDEQRVTPISKPGQTGEILIKRGWPSMFRAYLGAPESYRQAFVDNWYRSGDLAQWDENGELRFIGRVDDVIKTAGHMIGPAEVEAVLNHHPEVVECGVRGIPDPVDGNLVAAWVVPRHPLHNTEQLRHDLIAYARQRLGNAVAPRVLHFVAELPKTPSGKILRRELEEQT